MKELEFVKFVLRNTKEAFPTLYSDHMHGRLRQFVQEHAPSLKEKRGSVIGSVPGSLRVLWAISKFLELNLPRPTSSRSDATWNVLTGVLSDMRFTSTGAFASAVGGGFWEALLIRLKVRHEEDEIVIHHDWSIHVSPRPPMTSLTSVRLDRFGVLLQTAGRTHSQSTYFADQVSS